MVYDWLRLRSDIYIRDKGMCWICNTFVSLEDYDLGHLIDKCNGGHNDYDNLAVMHKLCNLSKPKHTSLEECLKWKLTAFMPKIKEDRGKSIAMTPHNKSGQSTYPKTISKPLTDKNILAVIVPGTLCWIQGRPSYKGGIKTAMWKVLPPPYRQTDLITTRFMPPGANDNGFSGTKHTLQILGGELTQTVTVSLGIITIHIKPSDSGLIINYYNNENSNTGVRNRTIGKGIGQISISEWREVRAKGLSLVTYREHLG